MPEAQVLIERGEYPTHPDFGKNPTAALIQVILNAGADVGARDDKDRLPFDYAKENPILKGTDAYWMLKEGQHAKK